MTDDHFSIARRRMLCGCASSLLLQACGGDPKETQAQASTTRGCLSVTATASQATSAPGCGLPALSSGSAAQDAAFFAEFNSQGNFWNIPGVRFAFLNDCNMPNALANPNDRSILFGLAMVQKLLSQFGSQVPLWQVMAHEWGHQIQFFLGDSWLNAATVAPKELEADMFSGFYLMTAKNTQNLSSSISAAFSLGDWEFNNPQHHGTPNQRGAAVVAGGRVALEVASGRVSNTYPAIRQRFAQELFFIL